MAKEQPWEGHHLGRVVCPLRSEPYGHKECVCQGTLRAFRGVVVDHHATEVVERAHDAGGEDADGRSIPHPPNGRDAPREKGERCPAAHTPPVAARVAIALADDKQGNKCYE